MSFIDILRSDFKKNKEWYLVLFLAPIVFFFFEFSNMSYTQDELRRHSSTIVDPQWISQARFGMYFLTWLYSSNPVFPYVGVFLSLVISSFSIRVFFESICKEKGNSILLLIIFISCPFSYYLYSFSTISFSIGIIYALCLFSVLFIYKTEKCFLFSPFVLSLSLSIYQSALTVYFLMVFIFLFLEYEKGLNVKLVFIGFIKSLIVATLSLLIYGITNELIGSLIIGNDKGYINSFVSFSLSIEHVSLVLQTLILRMWEILSASSTVLPNENVAQPIYIIAMIGLILYKHKEKSFFLMIFFLMILIVPFSLELMSPSFLPVRSYISIPLLFVFVIYWTFSRVDNVLFSNFLFGTTIIYLFFNLINITKLSFYEHVSWERDKQLASEIVGRIFDLDGLDELMQANGGEIPVHSVGYLYNQGDMVFHRTFENVGRGFFSWGDNELQNSSNLLKSLGWKEFTYAYPSEVSPYIDDIRKMPIWPLPGSVDIVGQSVVVKLSDYSEAQLMQVCKNNSLSNSCVVSYNPLSVNFSVNFDGSSTTKLSKVYEFDERDKNRIENSEIENIEDGYVITSSVGDPYILLPSIDTKDDVVLFIDFEFFSYQNITIYLRKSSSDSYSESNVMRLKPLIGRNKLYLTLPSVYAAGGIRVDFMDSDESFVLKQLSIYKQ